MMNVVFRLILSTALIPALAGCSMLFGQEGYFRDRGDDYLKADSIPPIIVPEGLSESSLDELYVIPSVARDSGEGVAGGVFEVPRPQELGTGQLTEKVKIQRLGESRWILINTPPSEVWPRVRNFLGRAGLQVAFTDATNGIIETDWLQFKTDPDNKDRYRLQIEQGVQPESTEIHVLHMSVGKDVPAGGQVNWPAGSANAERESWMIDELAATLASEESSGATSLLAQTIGGGPKVAILTTTIEPLLHMELPYTRAWATVGYAVQRGGFHLWDDDKTMGIYYVGFRQEPDEDEEPGFLSRWFGGDEDEPPPQTPYSLQQVLAQLQLEDNAQNRAIFADVLLQAQADALANAPGYLVVVRGDDNNIEVRVRDAYAQLLAPKQAQALLQVIRRNLI
ncbi:outer membrane protein assembly factor BamC [Exilibacterium tricleocarpae]|uniref:Outer membrane protein assembly factor BamC n=1 Tax=Exilibacterium tricleocarpae TaxID=2591008 RepID=A0A545U819_9GAMM|nr:outer membrane protein assembly factor BamC [Exilibacterium tricleocarpae]TQV85617.1 outer membrane protein assembly factor BamC [Exilibacterium tricleocarpae]